MSPRKNKELFEAVIFFGKKSIVKEMRYSEFEAVLDGVVGIAELANKEVNAAYVKITSNLKVHSVVTFTIEFNERGFADEDWNIPLRHLAENAGPGPDLGVGPIRLACRSQCSVSWYQRELWEPNQREVNHFQLLIEAVARNKLGLIADEDDDVPVLKPVPTVTEKQEVAPEVPLMSEQVEVPTLTDNSNDHLLESQAKEYQAKIDLLVSRQKQTLHSLEEKYRDEIDQVKRAMRNEVQSYRHRAQELEQQANQNKVLLEKLQSQNQKLERDSISFQGEAESTRSQYDELKDEYLQLVRGQRSEQEGLSETIQELKDQLTEKSVEIDSLQDDLAKANASLGESAEKLSFYKQLSQEGRQAASSEVTKYKSEVESKQAELAKLKGEQTGWHQEQKHLEKTISQLQLELKSLKASASNTEHKQIVLSEKAKTAELRVSELEAALKSAEAQGKKLKAELIDAQAEAESAGSGDMFERMEKLELVFVAYHPGAGHISLPARQLEDYLEKPLSIAAQKCGVTLEHYKAWLVHYDAAECEECGVPVKRIETPSDFQPGDSNRCSKHKISDNIVSMFRKSS